MMGETFIKMCKALPKEVQDLIPETIETRWCDGRVIYLDVDVPQVIVKSPMIVENIIYRLNDPFKVEKPFKVCRQEDLQEIAENKDKLLPSLQELRKYFKKITFTEMRIKIPMKWVNWWNILWLCFVMETCYKKQWDMEKVQKYRLI